MIVLPGFTAKNLPPADVLRSIFTYDPDSGILTRRKTGRSTTGKDSKDGYLLVDVFGITYVSHRVIWGIYYGGDPMGAMDHINGIKHDNRIQNLRCITVAQNTRNRRIQSSNTSGVKGVTWVKSRKKWASQIKINGIKINLGRYSDINDAKEAYQQASLRFHGEFGRVE